MFGNVFARTLMNTHAVQKNKGESGGDTNATSWCAYSSFFFAANTCMQRVPRRVKSG